MADNYLEKRMEEYRAGKLASKSRVVYAQGAKREPGDFTINFPRLRVVILGGPIEMGEALTRKFRMVDCRVAVVHSDIKNWTRIAQKEGCRYYPFDHGNADKCRQVIEDVGSRWGMVDVMIDLREVDVWNEAMPQLLLLHSHPAFGCVQSVEVGFEE